MNVGVFQKHAVIGFGWRPGVDAGINEVKHAAAGRLLHLGGEHVVAALLDGREHLRIIVEPSKVRTQAEHVHRLLNLIGQLLRQVRVVRCEAVQLTSDIVRVSVQLVVHKALQLIIKRLQNADGVEQKQQRGDAD